MPMPAEPTSASSLWQMGLVEHLLAILQLFGRSMIDNEMDERPSERDYSLKYLDIKVKSLSFVFLMNMQMT